MYFGHPADDPREMDGYVRELVLGQNGIRSLSNEQSEPVSVCAAENDNDETEAA